MVKVVYKNGKKRLVIDGRLYNHYALYYHIIRTISTYKYFVSRGEWEDSKARKVENHLIRYINIYKKYFPAEAFRNVPYWF